MCANIRIREIDARLSMRSGRMSVSVSIPKCAFRSGHGGGDASRGEQMVRNNIGACIPWPRCVPVVVLSSEAGMFDHVCFIGGLDIVQIGVLTNDKMNGHCHAGVFAEPVVGGKKSKF